MSVFFGPTPNLSISQAWHFAISGPDYNKANGCPENPHGVYNSPLVQNIQTTITAIKLVGILLGIYIISCLLVYFYENRKRQKISNGKIKK